MVTRNTCQQAFSVTNFRRSKFCSRLIDEHLNAKLQQNQHISPVCLVFISNFNCLQPSVKCVYHLLQHLEARNFAHKTHSYVLRIIFTKYTECFLKHHCQPTFKMDTDFVLCEAWTTFLYIILINVCLPSVSCGKPYCCEIDRSVYIPSFKSNLYGTRLTAPDSVVPGVPHRIPLDAVKSTTASQTCAFSVVTVSSVVL